MGINIGGYEEAIIGLRREQEERLGFTVDVSFIDNQAPCPVCGKYPTPAVLIAYRDLETHVAYLGWGCKPCATIARNDLLSDDMKSSIRARVMEWVA